jgi:two-component system, NarL family, response regulator YdfI
MIDVAIMASLHARRLWLERVVRAETSFRAAGVASTFAFLRSLLDQTSVEVVIIDLMSAPESESAREWLFELVDMIPVIVLASTPDPDIFSRIVRSEKGALLRDDATDEQIIRAIQSTSAGLLTLDSTLVSSQEAVDELAERLTPREIEVLRLLAEGFSNREIAQRLDVSEHTIKFHIRSILGKLGASTRTEAVTRGVRSGLIDL